MANWCDCRLIARGPLDQLDALRQAAQGPRGELDFEQLLPIAPEWQKEMAVKLLRRSWNQMHQPGWTDQQAQAQLGRPLEDFAARELLADPLALVGAHFALTDISEASWQAIGQHLMQLYWLCDTEPRGSDNEPVAAPEQLFIDEVPALRWRFLARWYIPYSVVGVLAERFPDLQFTFVHEAPSDYWPSSAEYMAAELHSGSDGVQMRCVELDEQHEPYYEALSWRDDVPAGQEGLPHIRPRP